uniref:Uncharacterized protein n=1 Tax=Hyaloperonospora arabidopsidis (strain Emoy2) TaxID=559515 RepID=M4BIH3_HYAAE
MRIERVWGVNEMQAVELRRPCSRVKKKMMGMRVVRLWTMTGPTTIDGTATFAKMGASCSAAIAVPELFT